MNNNLKTYFEMATAIDIEMDSLFDQMDNLYLERETKRTPKKILIQI